LNRKISTGALTEGAILAAITALLGVISYYIPFLTLLVFIWPIPIIILGKRHGLSTSIMATIAAGVLASLFTPIIYSIPIVIMYGLLGIALGFAYHKNISFIKTILIGYITALLSIIILLEVYTIITGISIITELNQMMRLTMDEVNILYQSMGIDPNTMNDVVKQMDEVITSMTQLFPATLLMIPMVVTLINMIVSEKILKRLGYDVIKVPPFRKWRLPNHASFGLFSILLVAIIGQYFNLSNFDMVYQNLLYLILIMFLVQGLSFVAHFFYAKNISKGVRIVGFIMILVLPIMQSLIQIIGLIDVVFNVRDKIKIEQS
jgi:uncharacterized protein YybS (DUF2232 family)